jgi:lipoprotein-anchoring transpeptidase ErfK/SrfK
MKTKSNNSFLLMALWPACAMILCGVLASANYVTAQTAKAIWPAPVKQKRFATSTEAATALIQGAEQYDVPALLEILGPGGAELVVTKDTAQDKQRASMFSEKAREKMLVTADPKNPNRVILSVGNDGWPYPVPIVKRGGQWYFDARAGRKEILDRRIGANELDALTICRGYVEVQKEYALQAHDGVNQYAQRILSTPGKRDGLAWKNDDGTWGGPVGEGIAKALQQGYTANRAEPYHGYYFKILKGQGPAAPLGKMDFLVKGVMIGGFALVAVPAEYRVTGVKTFIVSYTGLVHQKDLGPDSLNIVKSMEVYNPDRTWSPTNDSW